MQSLAQKVKSYIKNTNHFLNKIKKLERLPDGAFLYTMNVVSRYPTNWEGLTPLGTFLKTKNNKKISNDALRELGKVVSKNNIFEFDESTFKQKRGTAIVTKFVPPYTNGRF